MGPVFYSTVSQSELKQSIGTSPLSHYSVAWLHSFYRAADAVPICQHMFFSQYLRMLHYTVTGRPVDLIAIHFDDTLSPGKDTVYAKKDRHRVWKTEKALLHMVKTGNLNYKDALTASIMVSEGVGIKSPHPLRRAKVSAIVFCAIVCRAAMEGGMSPEEAYSLSDSYIDRAEEAKNLDETTDICMGMYDDFVRRMHGLQKKALYSEPIEQAASYIALHPEENLHAGDLARRAGYSVTYFTRRFRAETGVGICDFIKDVRIRQAKLLLETSELSIQEIADSLGFNTRNYFTRCFRESVGMTPMVYRKKRPD